ncbi:MAG: MFS transporter [Desulfobacteraceae bacterium]|nr:MFS transporter [Desulfobacteraceae bacterium]
MTSEQQKRERSALIVATVTSFMGPFMISAVNVALPTIQRDFSATAVSLSWIATSYLLAIAVFAVPLGRIADIHGRKKIFLWGLYLFTASSFLTAFAWSVTSMIILRVGQGAGTAMMVTTGMAIITSIFPPQRRGKAIGIYVSAVYIGLSCGPFAGGFLTEQFGWQSIFFLVAPIGVFSIVVTLVFLKGEWADARGEQFDISGSILYAVALILLIYGAGRLPGWTATGLITAGILSLGAFIRQELRVDAPVFDVRLFSDNKLFAFSSFAAMINYAATYAVTFLLSLYLQYIKGMSPQSAGSILIFQPVCMALFSPFAGKLSDRIEPRYIASAGMAITAIGLGVLGAAGTDTPLYIFMGTLTALGIGFALFSSPNMNAIMGSVQKKHYGIASGTVSTMRLLGQMVSMATATMVFNLFIGDALITPEIFGGFMKSYRTCLIIFVGLCVAGTFFSMFRGELRVSGENEK